MIRRGPPQRRKKDAFFLGNSWRVEEDKYFILGKHMWQLKAPPPKPKKLWGVDSEKIFVTWSFKYGKQTMRSLFRKKLPFMGNCVQTVHKQLLCPSATQKLDFSSTLKPFLHNFFAVFAPWPNFLPFFSLFPHFVMARRGQFSPPKSLPWPKTSIPPGGGKEGKTFFIFKTFFWIPKY